MAELHLSTALAAYADIFPSHAPKPTRADMEARWAEILSGGVGWLAEEEDAVIGIAGLVPDAEGGRLEAVYVAADRWGRGVGSRLVDEAEAAAVGRDWLPLRLWVLEANERTRHWYERRGWLLEPGRRRTIWGPIDDVGYVLGEAGAARWWGRRCQLGGGRTV